MVSFAGVNRAERTENMKNSTFAGSIGAGTFGAVAINGGIGLVAPYGADTYEPVTEIIDTVVTRSAEVITNIKANAHITLKELKDKIASTGTSALPKFKALMESDPEPVAEQVIGNGRLTVFANGYAVYIQDGAHTIIAVDRCGGYNYDFAEGHQYVEAEVFDEMEWSIRLLMEGERRLEHNRHKTNNKYEVQSVDDNLDWADATIVDFLREDNAQLLADEELRRLYAAIGKLTDKQQEVVQLYFFKGMTQEAIAEELGIGQRAVANRIEGALKKLKKVF